MKLSPLSNLAVLSALISFGCAQKASESDSITSQGGLTDEDEKFWARFLQAEGCLSIPTAPPSVERIEIEPECEIDLEQTCVLEGSGEPCVGIQGEERLQCSCAECARELRFRYTAAPCNSNPDCMDLGPLPPSFARISVTQGGTTFFDADVNINSDFVITNANNCLPETFAVFVTDPVTDTARQAVTVTTNCNSQGIALLESFGAVAFSGYSCSVDDVHNCFVNGEWDFCANNIGSIDLTITTLEVNVNGVVVDLISGVSQEDLELQPGEQYCAETTTEFLLCVSGVYEVSSIVEADDSSDTGCEEELRVSLPIFTAPPVPAPIPVPTPAALPSPVPVPVPVPPPVAAPVECNLFVDAECTIQSGQFQGFLCESPGIGIEPCRQRPTGATMLYNGGDCSQSDNRQFLKFTCDDFGEGPPTQMGEQSWIVVTDLTGAIVYHEDFVAVGDNYFLRTPPPEERFVADQIISIYSSSDATEATLLQRVQYHSSCSSNLELKNRFGANQLVEFINPLQGNVTCFNDANFGFDIVVPVSIDGDAAEIIALTANTNFGGFLDLSDQVAGQIVQPGGSISASITTTFDLTERQRYTLLIQVVASGIPSGTICTGTNFTEFLAGNPPSIGSLTAAPTRSPTVSPAPTPDPLTTACSVDAEIVCQTVDDLGRAISFCDDIGDPRESICGGDLEATGIGFRYVGANGFPDDIWITIAGGRTGTVASQRLQLQGRVYVEGDFRGQALVVVNRVNAAGTGPGDRLEQFSFDTNCSPGNEVLRLTSVFGSLELTDYRNALGRRSSINNIRMSYFVRNLGGISMIAEDAWINSAFQVASDFIPDPNEIQLGPRVREQLQVELEEIDFGAKFASGESLVFQMNVTGRGEISSLPCFVESTYAF